LLDHGGDPALQDRDGHTAIAIAAHRGRAAALELFEHRGIALRLSGVDALLAACALDRQEEIQTILVRNPSFRSAAVANGGMLLAQFAGVGNVAGVENLLRLGISVDARLNEGDGYFGIARRSTALHVAAWMSRPDVVRELVSKGANVNALDGEGRSPLQLAVKACIDSYWTWRRTPESVRALIDAGASARGISFPMGYDQVDDLLRQYS
jgi:ankyrin repeat protein